MGDPQTTDRVIALMRSKGLRVTLGYIQFLIRESHIDRPACFGRSLMWSEDDVVTLEATLRERGRFLIDEEPPSAAEA